MGHPVTKTNIIHLQGQVTFITNIVLKQQQQRGKGSRFTQNGHRHLSDYSTTFRLHPLHFSRITQWQKSKCTSESLSKAKMSTSSFNWNGVVLLALLREWFNVWTALLRTCKKDINIYFHCVNTGVNNLEGHHRIFWSRENVVYNLCGKKVMLSQIYKDQEMVGGKLGFYFFYQKIYGIS